MPKWKDHTLRPKPGVDLNIFPILHSTSYFVFFLFFAAVLVPTLTEFIRINFLFRLLGECFCAIKTKHVAAATATAAATSTTNRRNKRVEIGGEKKHELPVYLCI